MFLKARGSAAQPTFANSSHKIEAAAGSVVLITGYDVSGAGFETEAAMNAGKEFWFFVGE